MSEPFEVVIPLINPNEPEVQVVEVMVQNGQRVAVGDVLCQVETTKSSNEILAESPGFVVALRAVPGSKLRSGERICWLAEDADWQPPDESEISSETISEGVPEGMRITRPAKALIEASSLSYEMLPGDVLITEAIVQTMLMEQKGLNLEADELPMDESLLVIYGGGGMAKPSSIWCERLALIRSEASSTMV